MLLYPTHPTLAVALGAVALAVETPPPPASSARIAAVTAHGHIAISDDSAITWAPLLRCDLPAAQTMTDAEDWSRWPSTRPLIAEPASEPDIDALSLAQPTGDTRSPEETAPAADSLANGAVVRECARRPALAAIAWFDGALYVSCDGGPLMRWDERGGLRDVQLTRPSRADRSGASAPTAVVAMAADAAALWLADSDHNIWTLDRDHTLRWHSSAPEPVRALARWRRAVLVSGPTAVWRHRGAWRPLVTMAACALSGNREQLWLAGPDGLMTFVGEQLHTLSPIPSLAVAATADTVWLSDGDHVRELPAGAAADAGSGPAPDSAARGIEPLALASNAAPPARARWSPWFPDLEVRAQLARQRRRQRVTSARGERDAAGTPVSDFDAHEQRDRSLTVWLRLSWRLDLSSWEGVRRP
ncbi:MAG: hypothetical protein Tsb0020_13870 [Haliangiales bacterium]